MNKIKTFTDLRPAQMGNGKWKKPPLLADYTFDNHMEEFQNLLESTGDIAIYRLVPENILLRDSRSPLLKQQCRFYFWGAIKTIAGYSRRDFLSGNARWEEIVHPDDYQRLVQSRDALFSGANTNCDLEYRIRHKKGSHRWVSEKARVIFDARGNPVHIQGMIRDISALKRNSRNSRMRSNGVRPKSKANKPNRYQKAPSEFLSFTPSEFIVVGQIKNGKSTKEIADHMDLSVRTVESYRDNIRKKLGLKHRKINLRTYLLSNRIQKGF